MAVSTQRLVRSAATVHGDQLAWLEGLRKSGEVPTTSAFVREAMETIRTYGTPSRAHLEVLEKERKKLGLSRTGYIRHALEAHAKGLSVPRKRPPKPPGPPTSKLSGFSISMSQELAEWSRALEAKGELNSVSELLRDAIEVHRTYGGTDPKTFAALEAERTGDGYTRLSHVRWILTQRAETLRRRR